MKMHPIGIGKSGLLWALSLILALGGLAGSALAANGIGLFLNASTGTNKTSVVRLTNLTGNADTVTATAYSEAGTQLGTAGASLGPIAANQTVTFTSAQLESTIGFVPGATTAKYSVSFTLGASDFQMINYTRDVATGALTLAQSLTSDRSSGAAGTSVTRSAWFVSSSTSANKTNVLRILNTSSQSGSLSATLYDEDGNLFGSGSTTLGTIAAHQMLTYTSADLESAMGFTPVSSTAKYRVAFTANLPSMELINFTKDVATGNLALVQAQVDDRAASTSSTSSRNVLVVYPSTSTDRNTTLRLVNPNSSSATVTAIAYTEAGTMAGSGTLGTLAANQILALTSSQIETALGYSPSSAAAKYRLALSANVGNFEVINNIKVPSTGNLYLAQAQTDNKPASTASASTRHAFIVYPAASTVNTTLLQVINTTAQSAALTASAYDDNGALVASGRALGTLGANQMLSFTSAQLESLLAYTPPTSSSKWRVVFSANLPSFELINYAKDVASGLLVLAQAQTGEIPLAPTNVALTNPGTQTVGSSTFSSSTRLGVNWTKPSGYTPDHYLITAAEVNGISSMSFSAAGADTSATLSGLKSSTSYNVVVTACKDSACSQAAASPAAIGRTSQEYWQLQGSGSTVAGLTRVVSDGNVRIAVMRYGSDAPDALKNRMQLYYGPNSLGSASGLATALSAAVANAATPSTYLSFTSAAGTSGLKNPTTAATLVKEVNAGQALPMSSAAGGYVRIYFEAQGNDNKTRILSINSRDGYVGKDFNSGDSGVCQSAADYNSGGGCEPTVVIPVEGDVGGNSKINNARQFKIGFPMQDDWRWNESAGTFMVFTVDSIAGCTTYGHNQAYAVWNGSKWVVQYEAGGCPKLMKSMQAATPVHLGGARYKLYYGDPSDTTGRTSGSTLPFLGPKKIIYADGAATGAAGTVEFEDWESTANARGINFLWPSGDLLSATAEGYIDDFMVVAPTGSLDSQVYYVAITDGTIAPFSAAALLLNP